MSSEGTSASEEFVKVEELTPRSRGVNIVMEVVSKSEARTVSQSDHKAVDALVGDETGSIILTLWDDTMTKYKKENQ